MPSGPQMPTPKLKHSIQGDPPDELELKWRLAIEGGKPVLYCNGCKVLSIASDDTITRYQIHGMGLGLPLNDQGFWQVYGTGISTQRS